LGRVHGGRRTPHVAILGLLLVLLALASAGSIANLAAATVLLLLVVFIAVNAALVVLKRRAGEAPGRFEVPLALPLTGMVVCLALLVTRLASADWRAPAFAGLLLLASVGLYAALRAAKRDAR
jgi:APA family basic amino acid/polyamine antiporter